MSEQEAQHFASLAYQRLELIEQQNETIATQAAEIEQMRDVLTACRRYLDGNPIIVSKIDAALEGGDA